MERRMEEVPSVWWHCWRRMDRVKWILGSEVELGRLWLGRRSLTVSRWEMELVHQVLKLTGSHPRKTQRPGLMHCAIRPHCGHWSFLVASSLGVELYIQCNSSVGQIMRDSDDLLC